MWAMQQRTNCTLTRDDCRTEIQRRWKAASTDAVDVVRDVWLLADADYVVCTYVSFGVCAWYVFDRVEWRRYSSNIGRAVAELRYARSNMPPGDDITSLDKQWLVDPWTRFRLNTNIIVFGRNQNKFSFFFFWIFDYLFIVVELSWIGKTSSWKKNYFFRKKKKSTKCHLRRPRRPSQLPMQTRMTGHIAFVWFLLNRAKDMWSPILIHRKLF